MKSAVAVLSVCSSSLQQRDSLRERRRSAAKWESPQTMWERSTGSVWQLLCNLISTVLQENHKTTDSTITRDKVTRCHHGVMKQFPYQRQSRPPHVHSKISFSHRKLLKRKCLQIFMQFCHVKKYALNRQKGERKRSGNWFMTLLQTSRKPIINHIDGFSGVSELVLEWTRSTFSRSTQEFWFPIVAKYQDTHRLVRAWSMTCG